MSSKRQRGEASSSKQSKAFDKKKFVSADASSRYAKLASKTIIPERGLRPDQTQDGKIAVMIAERDWFAFTEQPEPAVIPVVKEFYANAKEHSGFDVWVRGKTVSFASGAINQFYHLQPVERDAYARYVQAGPNYELIVQQLCKPDTSWKVKAKEAMQFPQSALNRYAKAWHAFICAKLMPSTHVSDVTKDRAVLLYCLVQGMAIDVGEVIKRSILRAIEHGTKGGLPHSSLICALCRQAGVKWNRDEPIFHPMPPLDHSLISRYTVWDGGMSNPRGLGFVVQPAEEVPMVADATAAAPLSNEDLSAQLRRSQVMTNRRLHRIAERQDVMHEYNVGVAKSLATLLERMNPSIEALSFPTPPAWPSYPPTANETEEEDSETEDDEDSEEVDHDD